MYTANSMFWSGHASSPLIQSRPSSYRLVFVAPIRSWASGSTSATSCKARRRPFDELRDFHKRREINTLPAQIISRGNLHAPLTKYGTGASFARFHYTPNHSSGTALRIVVCNAQVDAGERRGKHSQFLDEGVFFDRAVGEFQVKSPDLGAGARVGERCPVNRGGYNPERDDAGNNGDGRHPPNRRREPATAAELTAGILSLPAVSPELVEGPNRPALSLSKGSKYSQPPQGDSRAQSNYQGPAELQRLFEQSHEQAGLESVAHFLHDSQQPRAETEN